MTFVEQVAGVLITVGLAGVVVALVLSANHVDGLSSYTYAAAWIAVGVILLAVNGRRINKLASPFMIGHETPEGVTK